MSLTRTVKTTIIFFIITSLLSCASPENIKQTEDLSTIKYLETKNQKNHLIIVMLDYTIDRPIEKVFAYIIDPNSVPEWQSDISEQIKVTEGPIRTGTILRNTKKSLFGNYQYERKVIDFKLFKTYAFYNYDEHLEFEIRYNLKPVNDYVQLIILGKFKKPKKGPYRFIPEWLLQYGIKTVFLKHHRQLKINIENKY